MLDSTRTFFFLSMMRSSFTTWALAAVCSASTEPSLCSTPRTIGLGSSHGFGSLVSPDEVKMRRLRISGREAVSIRRPVSRLAARRGGDGDARQCGFRLGRGWPFSGRHQTRYRSRRRSLIRRWIRLRLRLRWADDDATCRSQ